MCWERPVWFEQPTNTSVEMDCATEEISWDSAYAQSLSITGPRHTSVVRVQQYTDLVECVLVPVAVNWGHLIWIPGSQHSCRAHQDQHLWASGGHPPKALTFLEEARFYCLVPEVLLFRGIPTEPEAFLCLPGMSGLQPCARTHPKQGLVLHSSSQSDVWQILTCNIVS